MTIRILALAFACAVVQAIVLADQPAVQYEYDTLHRLIKAVYSNGTSITYTYDAVGNRTAVTVTGSSTPLPPTIASLPSQQIAEDATLGPIAFPIGDPNGPFGLTVVAASSDTGLVPPTGLTLSGTDFNRAITVQPAADQYGTATITLTVSDGTYTASTAFDLTVTPVNDPPTLSAIANPVAILEDASAQTVSLTGITAGGGETQGLVVTSTSSNPNVVPNPTVSYSAGASGVLTYTPIANAFGVSTITVTVSDDGGTANGGLSSTTRSFAVAVNAVADLPQVTNATTLANQQTTSGLVISRSLADGGEVTHFRITGVTGGQLSHNDGVTPIPNGSFITFSEGNAGLKFTPAAGSVMGRFTVHAALDGTGLGLSSSGETATITVKQTTVTQIVSDTPDPSEVDVDPVTVRYSVTSPSGGPTPTGNVVVTVDGGSDTCTGTAAAGQCTLVLTQTGIGRTLRATYSGDAFFNTSSGTALHTVRSCPARPVVTSTADAGPGSLRNAILDACTNDTITFDISGAGPHLITLTSGELPLDKNLQIRGPGNEAVRISGGLSSRIFNVAAGKTVAISALTISDGRAAEGGGILNLGTLTITSSTLSSNAAEHGGALSSGGALTLLNTTVSGNGASGRGGGVLVTGGQATLVHVTVAANAAGEAGGGLHNAGALTLRNTLVAANTAPGTDANIFGPIAAQSNSVIGGDARLGPLQDNGGPTWTHALLPGSTALDKGLNATADTAGLTADQRGMPRRRDGADIDPAQVVDAGAFEADPMLEALANATVREDGEFTAAFRLGDSTSAFEAVDAVSSDPAVVPTDQPHLAISGVDRTRTLTVRPTPNVAGTTTLTLTATKTVNGIRQSASTSFVLTVGAVNDAPTIGPLGDIPIQEDAAGEQWVALSGITAGGGESQSLIVSATSDDVTLIPDPVVGYASPATSGLLKFAPVANRFGTARITVTVRDNGGTASGGIDTTTGTFVVTVNAVADTPQVTNATTAPGQQTTSGLVITRNPVDGSEVTHFRISSITGGQLFLNDGVTSIANGAFITVPQGTSGLKFTLAAGSAVGHFTVHAALNAAGLGLSSVGAVATIGRPCPVLPVVTSRTDGAPGSLREAIAIACEGDTIRMDFGGPYPSGTQLSTSLANGELLIDKDLAIEGWSGSIYWISGGNQSRVFRIAPGKTVSLSNLSIIYGAAAEGAGILNYGTLTIRNSLLMGNAADGQGAAIYNDGELRLLNTTISGNTAQLTGGALFVAPGRTATLLNVTLADNRAELQGGGISNGGGTVMIRNSIVANNSAPLNVDIAGGAIDQGNNLLTVDPRLAPLRPNGGPTWTYAPLAGSAALDRGDNAAAIAGGLTTDQRGFPRFRDAADSDTIQTVDIGAFEAGQVVEDLRDRLLAQNSILQIALRVGDAATPFDALTVTSSNPGIVPNDPDHMSLTGSGTDRTLAITPVPYRLGVTWITVKVTKVDGTSMEDTFMLTVTPWSVQRR